MPTRLVTRLKGRAVGATVAVSLTAVSIGQLAEATTDYVPMATPVAEGVYAIIGPTDGRTFANQALNNNQGFVVTPAGVVLIDSGASASGARLIAAAIGAVTDQPVRWVINTGSQDHRWLGNDYFRRQGAEIVALARTVATQRSVTEQQLTSLRSVLKERFEGTVPAYADRPIEGAHAGLEFGGVDLEVAWLGDAHFPGDAVVWLPQQRVLFSGDLIYVDRMLGILPASGVQTWREAFHRAEALRPTTIVPGHGAICNLAKARRDTGDYLDWLVAEVGGAVANWEELEEVVERLADAPQFAHLKHFESWHRTNVNRAYLEFERQ